MRMGSRGDARPCILCSTTVRPMQHDHASTTTGRGEHHGLPVVAPAHSVLPLPEHCVLVHVWSVCFACVGSFWASFPIFFNLLGPQQHLLISWFRLVNLNSVKNTKNKQITHNRRNSGINCIIIHFNPLKWLLNTQLIHANMTLVQDAMSKLPYEM